jgi:hypothetical protein
LIQTFPWDEFIDKVRKRLRPIQISEHPTNDYEELKCDLLPQCDDGKRASIVNVSYTVTQEGIFQPRHAGTPFVWKLVLQRELASRALNIGKHRLPTESGQIMEE